MEEQTYNRLARLYIDSELEKKVKFNKTARIILTLLQVQPFSATYIHKELLDVGIRISYKNVNERLHNFLKLGLLEIIDTKKTNNSSYYSLSDLGWFYVIVKGRLNLVLSILSKDMKPAKDIFPFFVNELLFLFDINTLKRIEDSMSLAFVLERYLTDLCISTIQQFQHSTEMFNDKQFTGSQYESYAKQLKGDITSQNIFFAVLQRRRALITELIQLIAFETIRRDTKSFEIDGYPVSKIPVGGILMSDSIFLNHASKLKELFRACYEITSNRPS